MIRTMHPFLHRRIRPASMLLVAMTLSVSSPIRSQENPRPGRTAPKPEATIVSRFEKDPKLTIRLVADSTQIDHPIAFAVDDFGRVFVAESFRYIDQKGGWTDIRYRMDWMDQDLASRSIEDRRKLYESRLGTELADWKKAPERVRLLENPDESGVYRSSSIFADGFSDLLDGTIAGLLATRDRLYVTNIPHLWELRGTHLPKSTSRKPLHTGFGVRLGYLGHDLHGLAWGLDGRLYFSLGDRGARIEKDGKVIADIPDTGGVFRCEADGSNLELFAIGLRNPQELAFDAYGNLWTCDNNADRGDKARWVWVLPGGDSGWRIGYQHLNTPGPLGAWTSEKLWYPPHPDQAGHIVPPVANLAQGPSGVAAHPGSGLSNRFTGQFLVCDYLGDGGGIYAVTVRKKGAGFEMLPPSKFLWSTPANDVDFSPDGAVLFSTWTGGIAPTSSGALYRVESPGLKDDPLARGTAAILKLDPSTVEPETLGSWLEHPDMRVRRHAQFELVKRGQPAADIFRNCIRNSPSPLARITSVWGLAQLRRLKNVPLPAEFRSWPNDPDPEFRAAVARVLGECEPEGASKILVSMLNDPDDHVKLAASLGLADAPAREATEPLLTLARSAVGSDPWLRHGLAAALSKCADPDSLIATKSFASPAARQVAVIALRKMRDPDITEFLYDPAPSVATDAARAIYEERIGSAMPRLAGFEPEKTLETLWPEFHQNAFLRRWMHANLRIGQSDNAERLARFAADNRFAEPLRAEAIAALADWKISRPFDGVQGLHFSVANDKRDLMAGKSQSETVAKILAAPDTSEKVLIAALGFVKTNPGRTFEKPLRSILDSNAVSPGTRSMVFESLMNLDAISHADLVRQFLKSPVPELKRAAISAVAKLPLDDRLSIVRNILDSRETLDSQQAIRVLAESSDKGSIDTLSKLVDSYANGKLDPKLRLEVREAVDRLGDAAKPLAEKVAEALKSRADDPVGLWLDALEGGDAAAGESVFRNRSDLSCVRCHQPADASQRVGPTLEDVGARLTSRQILRSIVKPNDEMAKGFETVTLALNDGTIASGLLQEEFPGRVVLKSAEGKTITIDKSAIEERTKGVSLMPEGQADRISLRDLRDLVAYLSSLKSKPVENTQRKD